MKKYFVVHFSGHEKTQKVGLRDTGTFNALAPLLSLGNVSRFSYWAGLNPQQHLRVANNVWSEINGYNGGNLDDVTFIIDGYSAGGVTGLHFALKIPDRQIAYIALSDAAFIKGETAHLMRTPGSYSYYLSENYFQVYQNNASNLEVHDQVVGYTNFLITRLEKDEDNSYHLQAVRVANRLIVEKMKSIIKRDI